jgi:diguanylate cyclase (GGDEF)-like protein
MKSTVIPQVDSLSRHLSSPSFRIIFIILGFVGTVLYRKATGSFGISLGYLYVLLIALSGLWFGLKGGLGAALIAMAIYVAEILAYTGFPHRDLVTQGLFFRFFAYFVGGFCIGYFSESERGLKRRLFQLAHYDELTGCTNYRFTMGLLEREIARTKRSQKDLSVALIDIDYFKRMNDSFGHLFGNEILKVFAKALKKSLREIDVAGRYGGDEFLLIFPETNAQQARIVLERFRKNLAGTSFTALGEDPEQHLSVRFSAGIATLPHHADNLIDLLEVVDNALYQAKRDGRDRTFVERRRQKRVKPPKDLKIELLSSSGQRTILAPEVVNFSANGMLATLSTDVPQDNFLCRLSMDGEQISSEYKCSVVHRSKTGEHTYQIGTSFIGIPAEI